MLHFIISIIIAILLFSVAFSFVAKVFSLSDQAVNSFKDLVKEVNKFGKSTKDTNSKLLIMDVGTIVAAFVPGETVFVYQDLSDPLPFVPSEPRFVYFPQPPTCKDKACLCLCRDSIEERNLVKVRSRTEVHVGQPTTETIYELTCNKLSCTETPTLAQSWSKYRTLNEPRRVIVQMTKENDKITLK